jgi:hypothetical protein
MYFADVSYPNILFFYDSDDLIGALAYATVYFIVFVLCTTFLIRKYLTQTSQDKKSLQEYMPYLEKLLNILVFIIVIITLTKHERGFLGFSRETITSFAMNLFLNLEGLQWVAIFLAIILSIDYKKKIYLLHFTILIFIVMYNVFVTTSKAPLFILVIMFIFYFSYSKRPFSKTVIIFLLSLAIINSYYSYFVRTYGIVHGTLSHEIAMTNFELARNGLEVLTDMTPSVIGRFSLLDTLINIRLRSDIIDKGYYQFGTVVELVNLIPRFIWPDRPFLYFGYFITSDIYGIPVFSSDSMGVIGESYFVMGNIGVIGAIIWSCIMFLMYYYLVIKSDSWILLLFYVHIYFSYLIQDNYIFQSFATLTYSLLILYILAKITILLSPKNVMHTLPENI